MGLWMRTLPFLHGAQRPLDCRVAVASLLSAVASRGSQRTPSAPRPGQPILAEAVSDL